MKKVIFNLVCQLTLLLFVIYLLADGNSLNFEFKNEVEDEDAIEILNYSKIEDPSEIFSESLSVTVALWPGNIVAATVSC